MKYSGNVKWELMGFLNMQKSKFGLQAILSQSKTNLFQRWHISDGGALSNGIREENWSPLLRDYRCMKKVSLLKNTQAEWSESETIFHLVRIYPACTEDH